MVMHYCIGTDIDTKYTGKIFDSFLNPFSTVFIVATGYWIAATQKGAAYTPTYNVIVGRFFDRYKLFSW